MGLKKNRLNWKLLIIVMVIGLSAQAPVLAEELNNVTAAQGHGQLSGNFKSEDKLASSCAAYYKNTLNVNDCRDGEVPYQAAVWLFLLALLAFVGLSTKRKV